LSVDAVRFTFDFEVELLQERLYREYGKEPRELAASRVKRFTGVESGGRPEELMQAATTIVCTYSAIVVGEGQ
jgi:hypothetical protein